MKDKNLIRKGRWYINLYALTKQRTLKEAAKKVIFLMAVPLRGGDIFLGFFSFCCHLKIINILRQTTYQHMNI